jgi:hypothetical protein
MPPAGLAALALLTLSLPAAQTAGDGPLYGRVTTSEGAVVEGFLRWDRNEASWGDYLDGLKEIPAERIREAERLDPAFAARQREARSIVAFGTRITWDEDDQSDPPASAAALRFGYLASLTVLDGRSARLELLSGDTLTLRSSSSDLGRGMRTLVVTEAEGTEHRLDWSDLERVDFLRAPGAAPAPARLHGTVETWGEMTVTGAVAWDLDEVVASDILDGRAGGEELEILFGDIETIEWVSDRSAAVVLRDGERVELRGTNDVDRDNRGIEVSDPAFGRVVVPWEDFRSIRFHPPEATTPRSDFSPGAPIVGTVHARDGREIAGSVRWNNDQASLWEALSGWIGETSVRIEFGAIRIVSKVDENVLEVTLRDGRSMTLEVDEPEDPSLGSRGVFVTPEGRATRLVLWRDFDRLELGG